MDTPPTSESTGTLVLAAAPLGNPADASARLAAELAEADVIAAEDTRRLRRLAADLGVQLDARVVSYFEGNEASRTPDLVAELRAGSRVVLVTDAGMPSVSDPGYRLVTAAIAAGVPVTAAPGPSAVLTALALSGLPVDRFTFEGFVPRKAGDRTRTLSALREEPRTMVFFESRHRLVQTLRAMTDTFGTERTAAVCRELTKTHEQVRRGSLQELVDWAEQNLPLGEITIVVQGHRAVPQPVTPQAAAARVATLEAEGMARKQAIAAVAAETGMHKREVYDAVVTARDEHPDDGTAGATR